MRKLIFPVLLVLFYFQCNAQNLDLVVLQSGDSVACKIDSVSESRIYLHIKTTDSKKWVYTYQEKENISSFEYDCINPDNFIFKDGTSVIKYQLPEKPLKYPGKTQLGNASKDELLAYLISAKKTKKTGRKLALIGAGTYLAGGALILADKEGDAYLGALVVLTGAGLAGVGVLILITGSSQIKKINKELNTRVNGLAIEFSPCSFYNYQAQNYQPGLSLRIKF